MLVVPLMDRAQDKKKGAGMTKYERIKVCSLVFIAAVLFVWAGLSVGTLIRYNQTQTMIEQSPPQSAYIGLVATLSEMADRLERLENQCGIEPSS